MLLFSAVEASGLAEEDDNRIIEQAIKRLAKGDTDAIGDVYDLTRTKLYGYILSILKNVQDTEDTLQDTYIKITTSAGLYHSEGKPMAWIFTIARNLSLMKLRSSSRFTDIEDFEWDQMSVGSDEFHVEDRMILETAMTILSDEESQIVMLHAVSGLKHREIADLYDMPLATVLSKYNRAIKKLQKEMEKG